LPEDPLENLKKEEAGFDEEMTLSRDNNRLLEEVGDEEESYSRLAGNEQPLSE
jgi:hypothetical protein